MKMDKLEFEIKKVVEDYHWNAFVESVFGKEPNTYNFQQQNGCRDRGLYLVRVFPSEEDLLDEQELLDEEISYKVNGYGEMFGVSLKTWLNTSKEDTKSKVGKDYLNDLFWARHFYPTIEELVAYLYKLGLLEEGDFYIEID